MVASRSIKTTINKINRPLLSTPPSPDNIDDVSDIAAPGSKRSIIAEPDMCKPISSKNWKKLVAELLIISLYCGRLSEKSFREVPKSEVIPMPIAIIPRITSTIAPIIGIP